MVSKMINARQANAKRPSAWDGLNNMTHNHQFKLIDTGKTYTTTMRSRGGAGTGQFVEGEMPLHQRRCECGMVEELRNGDWKQITPGRKSETHAQPKTPKAEKETG
jgi:hypothetical protein